MGIINSYMIKTLFIPDCHIPFEDKKAYDLMTTIGLVYDPHYIVILGDFADYYSVNSHGKHPLLNHPLIKEIDAVNKRLDELDEFFPDTKKIYIEGNHEFRLERYLYSKAPELFGLTEPKHLFKIESRPNWTWVKYEPGQIYNIPGTSFFAGHVPDSMSSPQASARKNLVNLVYGHIHKQEIVRLNTRDKKTILNACPGWLGDKSNNKVFGFVNGHHQWHLGFSTLTVTDSGQEHYKNHHISDNYEIIFEGDIWSL